MGKCWFHKIFTVGKNILNIWCAAWVLHWSRSSSTPVERSRLPVLSRGARGLSDPQQQETSSVRGRSFLALARLLVKQREEYSYSFCYWNVYPVASRFHVLISRKETDCDVSPRKLHACSFAPDYRGSAVCGWRQVWCSRDVLQTFEVELFVVSSGVFWYPWRLVPGLTNASTYRHTQYLGLRWCLVMWSPALPCCFGLVTLLPTALFMLRPASGSRFMFDHSINSVLTLQLGSFKCMSHFNSANKIQDWNRMLFTLFLKISVNFNSWYCCVAGETITELSDGRFAVGASSWAMLSAHGLCGFDWFGCSI